MWWETVKNTHLLWLSPSDHRMPYTTQTSQHPNCTLSLSIAHPTSLCIVTISTAHMTVASSPRTIRSIILFAIGGCAHAYVSWAYTCALPSDPQA